jgi:hypothetical protein
MVPDELLAECTDAFITLSDAFWHLTVCLQIVSYFHYYYVTCNLKKIKLQFSVAIVFMFVFVYLFVCSFLFSSVVCVSEDISLGNVRVCVFVCEEMFKIPTDSGT